MSFVLGIAVGVCLYSLFKLRPLFQPAASIAPPRADESQTPRASKGGQPLTQAAAAPAPKGSGQTLKVARHEPARPSGPMPTRLATANGLELAGEKVVAKPDMARVPAPAPREGVGDDRASREQSVEAASVLPVSVSGAASTFPATLPPGDAVPVGRAEVTAEVAAVNGQSATGGPTVFKPIGYVEKTDGQVEAIIVQENDVQVVHTGDLIAGRCRVTKISPEAVQTVDDSQVQPGMIPPMVQTAGLEAKNSIGFVQNADGRSEVIVADGDSVRLVPEASTVVSAQGHSVRQGGVEDVTAQARMAPAPVVPTVSSAVLTSRVGSTEVSAAQGVRPVGVEGSASTTSPAVADNAVAVAVSAQVEQLTGSSVKIKPLGYVVDAQGQFSAIVSQGDDAYLVRPGDEFAGHYRAVAVSADVVDAVEEPPRLMLPERDSGSPLFADLLGTDAQPEAGLAPWNLGSSNFDRFGKAPLKILDDSFTQTSLPPPKMASRSGTPVASVRSAGHDAPSRTEKTVRSPEASGTFIFQTLGYVEMVNEGCKAIVADGSEVYLVKPGDTFAGQYRATSVESSVVLAVRVPPVPRSINVLSAQTERSGKSASNILYGYLHFSLAGLASAQVSHAVDATSSPVRAGFGVNLLNSSTSRF